MGFLRTALFVAAIGFSAFLIFWLEPMVGKLLLPSLGGSPSVWNVCMVVYQLALLAGYLVALLMARLSFKQQLIAQAVLLAGAALTLPVEFDPQRLGKLAGEGSVVLKLAGTLLAEIGLPFVALATVSPLLQSWWARASETREPYFLYAASNAGSFIGLLGYPFIIERASTLAEQRGSWSWLFLLAGALILATGFACHRSAARQPKPVEPEKPAEPVPRLMLLKWAGLAFVPSSLTLGATAFLSSDVASIPLLWVLPLALYLLSFVIAFGAAKPMAILDRVMPPCALGLLFLWVIGASEPPWLLFGGHLLFLFLASLICHKRLALLRPPANQLTVFYLALAVGGALGGIFNSLLAPALFQSVIEYPLVIILATAIRIAPPAARKTLWWWGPLAPPVVLGLVALMLGALLGQAADLDPKLRLLVLAGIPLFAAFFLSPRPVQFATALALIALAARQAQDPGGEVLHAERNFFGVSRVTRDTAKGLHTYYHGTTIHGTQAWTPDPGCDPLAYYAVDGPLGQLFEVFRESALRRTVGAVGLGAGAVAAYSHEGDAWNFYEIDPAVIRIARNGDWFTYLRDCARVRPNLLLGDGRLKLQEAPPNYYGLLILDAFSSDAIPTHLLTREAFELYFSRLEPKGLVACHISSRHLDLGPVLAALARELNLHAAQREDYEGTNLEGTFSSHWIVLSRDEEAIRSLKAKPIAGPGAGPWIPMVERPGMRVWTDDYTDIISIISFR